MKYWLHFTSFHAKCWFVIAVIGLPCLVGAQTVRPLINELGNPAKGRVEYVNDSTVPLNVVIETRSFSVAESGEISYRPVDSNIHVKLSATSFRIPPKQSYFLFYEATADHAPAWFVIYAAFSGFAFRTEQGMNVRVQLPHTVYLLPKGGVEKTDLHIISANYDASSKKVTVIAENNGPNFGRVQQAFVFGDKKRKEVSGFPVFPQSRRSVEYDWDGEQPPERVVLDLDKFKVEGEVTRSP